MAEKFARLTHKIAIKLHLFVESCTICSSRSRRPVRKLLDTPSLYIRTSCPAHPGVPHFTNLTVLAQVKDKVKAVPVLSLN